jgi:hypothetical protein
MKGNGEGSIYQRSSDGRWLGVLNLGYESNGRPVRKSARAKIRTEEVIGLDRSERLGDEISLSNVGADLFEHLEARGRFDAFGDEREVKGTGEFDGGAHDGACTPVASYRMIQRETEKGEIRI